MKTPCMNLHTPWQVNARPSPGYHDENSYLVSGDCVSQRSFHSVDDKLAMPVLCAYQNHSCQIAVLLGIARSRRVPWERRFCRSLVFYRASISSWRTTGHGNQARIWALKGLLSKS